MTIKVFVYGSLKRGFQNHTILTPKAEYLHDDTLKGAFLISLGAFPGMLPGDKEVHGELYSVTPEILQRLDRLEGHPSFYERRKVTLASGECAWTYYLNQSYESDVIKGSYKVVENGKW